MRVVSFFAGAGGLDLGFEQAGFDVIWANEFDKDIWETYRLNHKHTYLDTRSITDIDAQEVPDCDGIIGGPPCQSWSAAGSRRGIEDKRGQLFFDFIRILEAKRPKFFLAENVSGMLSPTHSEALERIKSLFRDAGYSLSFRVLNASDYGLAQERKRVFFVGYREDLGRVFDFPLPSSRAVRRTLRDVIYDLKDTALPRVSGLVNDAPLCTTANHEYMVGGFSSIFMSRNRVRSWDEPSFTIQAGARHAPLHPQAPKMQLVAPNKRIFIPGEEDLYRRLSVRECARIQSFPDDFVFCYRNIVAGYKMIGNAVPVELARQLAVVIREDMKDLI